MLSQKLQDFDEEIKYLDQTITKATVDLYQTIEKKYLPTPTKIHYVKIETKFFYSLWLIVLDIQYAGYITYVRRFIIMSSNYHNNESGVYSFMDS
jgi:hypothetical protein